MKMLVLMKFPAWFPNQNNMNKYPTQKNCRNGAFNSFKICPSPFISLAVWNGGEECCNSVTCNRVPRDVGTQNGMATPLQYHFVQCRPRGIFIDSVHFGGLSSSYRLYNTTV